MKLLERYYKKIYKHSGKLLKKVFGLDVEESMAELYKIKHEIETKIEKPINEITNDDLIKNKLSNLYCKYKTLYVLSGAAFISSFCDENIEEIKK